MTEPNSIDDQFERELAKMIPIVDALQKIEQYAEQENNHFLAAVFYLIRCGDCEAAQKAIALMELADDFSGEPPHSETYRKNLIDQRDELTRDRIPIFGILMFEGEGRV
jgi:hypothetical protein